MSLAKEFALFAKDRSVVVSDGTTIAYTVTGDGDRTPILFVNGWTCSDAYWRYIGPGVMDRGHRAVFVDTRGHGESGLPREPGWCAHRLRAKDVAVTRLAADIVEVLDDAGLDRVGLAGHSMGVQTIFEVCRQAPDRVSALFPIAGAFENPVRTFADLPILDRLYPFADVVFRLVPFELLRPVIRRTAARPSGPEVGVRVVQRLHIGGPKVTAEHLAPHVAQVADVNFSVLFRMMSGLRAHSTADFLPKITAPTLVLAGRRDLFTPPSVQQRMADLVPDSEIVWFEDGGHMLPVEEPEGIVAAMDDFLARRVDPAAA